MEKKSSTIDFFLATTTASGFHGYFDQLGPQEGLHLYLLKAGPGCGKSTLMRRLASQAQEPLQYIHCSSDPDSLDGVIFCRQQAAVLDATPPHALEPRAPGVEETVISLYDTLNPDQLRPQRAVIQENIVQGKLLRQHATRYVASASSILMDSRRTATGCTDFAKVRQYVHGLANRLLPKMRTPGQEQVRFLSGITPQGMIFYRDTIPALADQIYVFHDTYGAASRLAMDLLRSEALARGCQVITCRCALHPEDKIDHLILPGLGLAFLTSNPWHTCKFAGQKNIHCSRFTDRIHLHNSRTRLHFNQKAADSFLNQAIELMAQARVCHNALEACYAPSVDFSAVDKQAAHCAALLGLEIPPKA